jgi:hypothetical protein
MMITRTSVILNKQMSMFTSILLISRSIFANKTKTNLNSYYFLLTLLFLVCVLGFSKQVYAQSYNEVEPNNTCSSAQELLSAVIPIQVMGFKTSNPADAVDYYKFTATPGTQLRVTLDGNTSTPSPLTAYGVGLFASNCPLYPSDSRWGINTPAKLDITVPIDGIVIIGVTACCDLNFSGSGTLEGYYILSVTEPPPPTVITGRVVDADTNSGLPGSQSPFASVTLERCFDYGYWGYCYYWTAMQTDLQGNFRFQGDFDGNFRIRVNADSFLYEQPILSPTGPKGFESVLITSGSSYDFGVIPLVPIIPVDSISGQLRDKVTGLPLTGGVEPFARVELFRLSPYGTEYVAGIPTNDAGIYKFSSAVVGHPLYRGDYRVVGYANQYQRIDNYVDLINVQGREARVAPALTLLSNPVRFTDIKPCNNIPAEGGNCDFSYTVTDGTANLMKGVAWSLVDAVGTGGFVNSTSFVSCEQPLTLMPGTRVASKEVHCRFTVPASVPDNATFCPDARFGEGSRANPHFTVQGLIDPLFCLNKLPGQGSIEVMPQREAVELMRHRRNQH